MNKFIIINIFLLLFLPNIVKSQCVSEEINLFLKDYYILEYIYTPLDGFSSELQRKWNFLFYVTFENLIIIFEVIDYEEVESEPKRYTDLMAVLDCKYVKTYVYTETNGQINKYLCVPTVYIISGNKIYCPIKKASLCLLADFDLSESDSIFTTAGPNVDKDGLILQNKYCNEYGMMIYDFCNHYRKGNSRSVYSRLLNSCYKCARDEKFFFQTLPRNHGIYTLKRIRKVQIF